MALRNTLFALSAWTLAACAILYFTPAAEAGWGGGSCGPVGPPPMWVPAPQVVVPAHAYTWGRYDDGDPDFWILRDRNRLVGVWCVSSHTFRPTLSPTSFGAACASPVAPPADPPCVKGALPGDNLPTGVVPERISVQERYTVNGREVTQADAERAVSAPGGAVPDDSAKPSLTAIGTAEECAKVKADMAAAGVLDLVVWQDYRPADVMVAKYGFVTDGHPAVHLETPDGKDLYPHDAYDPKTLAEAVRKADPNYDPKKVAPPAPADPVSALVGEIIVEVQKVPGWVWVAFVALAVVAVLRRKT